MYTYIHTQCDQRGNAHTHTHTHTHAHTHTHTHIHTHTQATCATEQQRGKTLFGSIFDIIPLVTITYQQAPKNSLLFALKLLSKGKQLAQTTVY